MNKFHDSLQKYLDIYAGQETYFSNDTRSLEFYKEYPLNKNRQDIIQKISVIADADLHKFNAQDDLADHILKLNIDPRLAKGDLSVVEDIAKLTLNGVGKNLLHAASEYCNLHRPDVFPIYSEQHFPFYKQYIKEHKLGINPEDLNQYQVFAKALNDIIDRYHIRGKLNYLQMRKFAWIYAAKVLAEAHPSKD